ncbi:Crp/Fnr family transcriptional regulator [Photobacterium sp. SDRW27]|uniref:Crp/Fnr family transcriptional regulator n=1 Tax=Photobacterium obscurum TaxID=2829490 RepID=UPI0022447B6C|nr:Crp/Fnr family transcriptional regulator [Photobacterium obscurum]MCW8330008.1 Crp/Fnr family transcriptional regulator [Photobacterium obscurum]
MQLHPYPSTRFTSVLAQRRQEFQRALYDCQTGTQVFEAGDTILEQGQPIHQLYVISVGKISMHICALNGRRFQLGELNCDHHIFGEMEFFTSHPCQWNVVADDRMEADVICATQLQQCLTEQPQLALFFATALAWDYQESMDIYTNRVLHPIAYNIAFDLWQRDISHASLGAFDKVEHEAERFGTSSRVYRRALNSLIEQGLIEKNDNQIQIRDRQALEAFIAIR